ncbi:Ig-like domain-containing protein [Paenibacillus sp. CAU 1782]
MLRASFKGAFAVLLAASLILNGWTGIANAAEETVTGVEINYDASDYDNSSSALNMYVEDDKVTVNLFASISGSSSKKDVTSEATWKTSSSTVVKVDKGVLTGVGSGTATISATYKGYTASIKATSQFIYDEIVLMDGDDEAPATISDIKLGESLNYTLIGRKDNKSTSIASEAVWTTTSSSVATVDEGKITLVGTGTATITAKYKGKSDSVKITVTSPYKSIELVAPLENGVLELEVGTDDKVLTAVASPKTGGTTDVTQDATWTSGNAKVLTVVKGVVTPVAPGKTKITVSHLGVTSSIDVVVRTPYQFIKLTPEKELHIQMQEAPIQVQAEVLNNSNISYPVTTLADWTSSDVLIATVVNGKVTPRSPGTVKITAAYKGVSRSIDVVVYPSITKITAEKATLDGFKGLNGDLPKLSATTFDGSTIDVTKLATWTVSDVNIATIEGSKWEAKTIGEVTLTATIQGYQTQVKLIVHVKPLKLLIDNKDLSIVIGKTVNLPKVTVVNEDGEEEDITTSVVWTTKSDNIVIKDTTMRGLEASTVALTGTYLNKSVSIRIKIEDEIVKLVAEPTQVELNPGRTKTIKVTGYYKNGKTVSVGSKVNWSIAQTAVAVLNGSSGVKAVAPGATILTGTYQEQTVQIVVIVKPKLKSLQLSAKSVQLSPGSSQTISLQAVYTTGTPVTVTDSAVWTSSKPGVATIKDGKITAIAKGSTSIKATFDGKSVTIRVTVK